MKRGDFDVIVLGGGVGGLTAGAILAANGARVLLHPGMGSGFPEGNRNEQRTVRCG